ncbi:MAG: tRNA1Val (adenine37-N6)-methyltransferase [Saprospiraceae bacterium]|jgi:tRNA1Val (adenine37-N6)-methyltransferase
MEDLIKKTVKDTFRFKEFSIDQESCSMKVGTDGVLLGAWTDIGDASSILDIGAGSGLIALMLAQRSAAVLHAIEIDEDAWRQASQNFERSKWHSRMTAVHTPVQEFARIAQDKYDLIVSNPPFFSGGAFSADQERANVRHTIKLPNGDLLSAARSLMSKEGRFCVILPLMEGLRFKEMAVNYGLYCNKMTEVRPFANRTANRLLLQFEKTEKELIEDSFVIWEKEQEYAKDFITLTEDFYLHF